MSAITWTAESSATPMFTSKALMGVAWRVGLVLGLATSTGATLIALSIAVLMASSIIQF